jgi:hypothetical protein
VQKWDKCRSKVVIGEMLEYGIFNQQIKTGRLQKLEKIRKIKIIVQLRARVELRGTVNS